MAGEVVVGAGLRLSSYLLEAKLVQLGWLVKGPNTAGPAAGADIADIAKGSDAA